MTTGTIVTQAVSQELTQFSSAPSAPIRQIVMAAAMAVVSPDCISANRKCAYRCGSMGAGSPELRAFCFSINVKPVVNKSDDLIEQGVFHIALARDELHQLVGPLDVECAVVKCPSGGGWP